MKKKLSTSQIVCILLLWLALCCFILANAERIDGPLILSLVFSGVLVIYPAMKSLKKNK